MSDPAMLCRSVLVRCLVAAVLFAATGCQQAPRRGGGSNDSDGDGVSNTREAELGTDPRNPDSDGDGLDDGRELALGTSPLARDSDGDGLQDNIDPEPTIPASNGNQNANDNGNGNDNENANENANGNENDNLNDNSNENGNGNDNGDADEEPMEVSDEPNDTISQATVVIVTEDDASADIDGVIDEPGDIDIYDIGALFPGDQVTATVAAADDDLELRLVIFNENGAIFAANDGESAPATIEVLMRAASRKFVLAVAEAFGNNIGGAYTVTVEIERDVLDPPAQGQTIFLDFDGGSYTDAEQGVLTVEPFDAFDIDDAYDEQTGVVQTSIFNTLQDNFAGFNVTLIASYSDAPPATGTATTILFGRTPQLIGAPTDQFDAYNAERADRALVATSAIVLGDFTAQPTATQLGVALGNIAAQRMGRLLGLRYVDSPTDLMDRSIAGDLLLSDLDFETSPLEDEVFPVGVQDANTLLFETIGLD